MSNKSSFVLGLLLAFAVLVLTSPAWMAWIYSPVIEANRFIVPTGQAGADAASRQEPGNREFKRLSVRELPGDGGGITLRPGSDEANDVSSSIIVGQNSMTIDNVIRPSHEVLENNRQPGPDGLPNNYFYTAEQARQLGLKKYTSGPCRNYYRGEEWWCNPGGAR